VESGDEDIATTFGTVLKLSVGVRESRSVAIEPMRRPSGMGRAFLKDVAE
jgi:hypothetical protein